MPQDNQNNASNLGNMLDAFGKDIADHINNLLATGVPVCMIIGVMEQIKTDLCISAHANTAAIKSIIGMLNGNKGTERQPGEESGVIATQSNGG